MHLWDYMHPVYLGTGLCMRDHRFEIGWIIPDGYLNLGD